MYIFCILPICYAYQFIESAIGGAEPSFIRRESSSPYLIDTHYDEFDYWPRCSSAARNFVYDFSAEQPGEYCQGKER